MIKYNKETKSFSVNPMIRNNMGKIGGSVIGTIGGGTLANRLAKKDADLYNLDRNSKEYKNFVRGRTTKGTLTGLAGGFTVGHAIDSSKRNSRIDKLNKKFRDQYTDKVPGINVEQWKAPEGTKLKSSLIGAGVGAGAASLNPTVAYKIASNDNLTKDQKSKLIKRETLRNSIRGGILGGSTGYHIGNQRDKRNLKKYDKEYLRRVDSDRSKEYEISMADGGRSYYLYLDDPDKNPLSKFGDRDLARRNYDKMTEIEDNWDSIKYKYGGRPRIIK